MKGTTAKPVYIKHRYNELCLIFNVSKIPVVHTDQNWLVQKWRQYSNLLLKKEFFIANGVFTYYCNLLAPQPFRSRWAAVSQWLHRYCLLQQTNIAWFRTYGISTLVSRQCCLASWHNAVLVTRVWYQIWRLLLYIELPLKSCHISISVVLYTSRFHWNKLIF